MKGKHLPSYCKKTQKHRKKASENAVKHCERVLTLYSAHQTQDYIHVRMTIQEENSKIFRFNFLKIHGHLSNKVKEVKRNVMSK